MQANFLIFFLVGLAAGLATALEFARRSKANVRRMKEQRESLEIQARNARDTRDAVGEVIGSMTQRVLGPLQNISNYGSVLEQSTNLTEAQRSLATAVNDGSRQLKTILSYALLTSPSTTGNQTAL